MSLYIKKGTSSLLDHAGALAEGSGCCCGVISACCAETIPLTVTATISNVVGCSSLSGVTISLVSDLSGEFWIGSTTVCGRTFNMTLRCTSGGAWGITGDWGSGGVTCVAFYQNAGSASAVCDPFHVSFSVAPTDPITHECDCCGDATLTFDVDVVP